MLAKTFAQLKPLADRYKHPADRAALLSRSICVHNHGDVTPKNVMVDTSGEVQFFDFNNAFFGPRLADVMDGGFEFSLAEKYIEAADFSRFDQFLRQYSRHYPFTSAEYEDLPHWIAFMGIIKFTKEVRVLLENSSESLRERRALAIANFVLTRSEIH
jgi:Ser/Thr protein kinase RdoA (MazF antagonist)